MRWMLSRAVALVALLLGSVAIAQPPQNALPQPRITSVFPMGAKFGTTVELTVNGTDLDDASALFFSHPGLSGEIVALPVPKVDPKAKVTRRPRR